MVLSSINILPFDGEWVEMWQEGREHIILFWTDDLGLIYIQPFNWRSLQA